MFTMLVNVKVTHTQNKHWARSWAWWKAVSPQVT